jgi:hypothetical protein
MLMQSTISGLHYHLSINRRRSPILSPKVSYFLTVVVTEVGYCRDCPVNTGSIESITMMRATFPIAIWPLCRFRPKAMSILTKQPVRPSNLFQPITTLPQTDIRPPSAVIRFAPHFLTYMGQVHIHESSIGQSHRLPNNRL